MVCIMLGVQYGRQDGRQKFKFAGKMRKLKIFFARVIQYDRIKNFAAFGSILYIFSLKNGENTHFCSKMA